MLGTHGIGSQETCPTFTGMMNFIPVFPLSLVAFPGERLHLHIFEPRYKQLIAECFEQGKPFGIPAVVDQRMTDMGTLMTVHTIAKTYDNGEMDITTQGERVFRILEKVTEVPGKLYAGAIVEYPEDCDDGDADLLDALRASVEQIHRLLDVKKKWEPRGAIRRAFDLAHHAGMSIAQEFEMLSLFSERQRQEYLRRHVQRVLPVLVEMEALKQKIGLNGHFKNLPGFEPLA